jgi:hypothetical protein
VNSVDARLTPAPQTHTVSLPQFEAERAGLLNGWGLVFLLSDETAQKFDVPDDARIVGMAARELLD